ncbi:MAG: hypothetical protein ACUVRD_01535 [Bacteroidia bacterium]
MANADLLQKALQSPDLRKSIKGILQQALEELQNPTLPDDERQKLFEQAEKLAKEIVG